MLNTITTENKQTPEIHINLCRMRKYTPPPQKKGEQKFKNTCTCLQIYRNWFNSNILFCSKRTEKDKETIFKGIYVFFRKKLPIHSLYVVCWNDTLSNFIFKSNTCAVSTLCIICVHYIRFFLKTNTASS